MPDLLPLLPVAGAAAVAGALNAAVGSGSLITLPALLAAGLPPVTAIATNTVGLAPGTIAAALESRKDLRPSPGPLGAIVLASAIGAIGGALLLVTADSKILDWLVPVLLAISCLLVLVQPMLERADRQRRPSPPGAFGSALAVGVYGGYFGAAQGVLLLAAFGLLLRIDLRRANAVKNLAQAVTTSSSAMLLLFIGTIRWDLAAAVVVGSVAGAVVGVRLIRWVPTAVMRWAIVAVGIATIVMWLLP